MNSALALRVILALSTVAMASSCAGTPPSPPQMVQLCLRDESEVEQLVDLLESTASGNGMTFVDRSSASQLELRRLKKDPGYRVISISASRPDGLGLAAGNLGLGAYEMAIGFTQGSNAQTSAAFVDKVMASLKSKWDVRLVASGKGAMKSTACRAQGSGHP